MKVPNIKLFIAEANTPKNPEDAIKNQNVNPDVKRNQQDSSDQVSNSPLKDL